MGGIPLRKIAFKALVGSHNYGLATETSDKDYKVFVVPTFSDLYHGRSYSNSEIGKEADYDYHDIRKVVELFWKSNVNFIEVLYSKDIVVNIPLVQKIFDIKSLLVTMNLPYLYKACKGMYFNKIKYLHKGTEGTQHLVDLYGYDTKQALHAYRILDFIMRFADTDFTDFKYAMTYNANERKGMLAIKDGHFSLEEYNSLLDSKLKKFETYEDLYLSQAPNTEIKSYLESIVYGLIKKQLGVVEYD